MSLLSLPTELLTCIAVELAQDGAQGALASLARLNRLLNTIVTPLLYGTIRLRGHVQSGLWIRTAERWINPWTIRAMDQGEKVFPRIQELGLESIFGGDGWVKRCSFCSGGHRSRDHMRGIYAIGRRIPLALFQHLTALSITDCRTPGGFLAELLGPLKPLRVTLRSFTLVRAGVGQLCAAWFLFLHLAFVKTSTVYWADEGHVLGDTSEAQRQAGITDWAISESFLIVSEGDTARDCLSQPPTLYTFTALTHMHYLILDMLRADELFIIFCTNLLPSLVDLELEGEIKGWAMQTSELFFFRRSMHRPAPLSPAIFLAPVLLGALPPPHILSHWWDPLSRAEVASDAFKDYRGPSLRRLDMSKLVFDLTV